jgi:hypothetical protein
VTKIDDTTSIKPLDIRRCNKDQDFLKNDGPANYFERTKDLQMYCIDKEECESLELMGDRFTANHTYISIDFQPCQPSLV